MNARGRRSEVITAGACDEKRSGERAPPRDRQKPALFEESGSVYCRRRRHDLPGLKDIDDIFSTQELEIIFGRILRESSGYHHLHHQLSAYFPGVC